MFGLDKLGGLRDIFPEDELGLNRGPEAEVREDLLRGAAVRGVRGVRDREFFYEGVLNDGARIVEIKILARGPEDEPAERVRGEGSGVGVLGRDESVRVAEIGGEKDIGGRAVGDLGASVSGGAAGDGEDRAWRGRRKSRVQGGQAVNEIAGSGDNDGRIFPERRRLLDFHGERRGHGNPQIN